MTNKYEAKERDSIYTPWQTNKANYPTNKPTNKFVLPTEDEYYWIGNIVIRQDYVNFGIISQQNCAPKTLMSFGAQARNYTQQYNYGFFSPTTEKAS